MDYRQEMLDACAAYCARTGKSRSTVATWIVNDGKFFDRIQGGGNCLTGTYHSVMRWFADRAENAA